MMHFIRIYFQQLMGGSEVRFYNDFPPPPLLNV